MKIENKTGSLVSFVIHLSLFGALLVLSSKLSFGQEVEGYIPDGTSGEQLEVVEGDSVPEKWKGKRWRLFPGSFSSLKLGLGFLYEYAAYSQDSIGIQQMDSIGSPLEPGFAVRDFRLWASGKFRTKRIISWKIGLMYDASLDSWLTRESGIMIYVPELWGNFFIGRTKEGFSLNKVMNGYSGWTMERQMALDVIPILADGIKWLAYLPETRIFWNAGIYNDWLSYGQGFSTYSWQVAVRTGWLPVYSKEENKVLHTALSYRYGEPLGHKIRVRSRPEVNAAPRFIDTGEFPAEQSDHLGAEVYYASGPLMIGSEVYWHSFGSEAMGHPVFFGGDGVISYILTGESRPYQTSTGIFGFVPVNRSVFKGGPGAWEIVLRASALDLNGGLINGGSFWRITPMINWYLSTVVRLEIQYGYGVLDRFGLEGATQFFQSRIQITFL